MRADRLRQRSYFVINKVHLCYASKACNACEVICAKPLNEREYVYSCGTDAYRDDNAGINILERVLAAHEAAKRLGEPNVHHRVLRATGKTVLEAVQACTMKVSDGTMSPG